MLPAPDEPHVLPAEPAQVHETVGRFRGLESPAVIIMHADRLSDTELFCAYSRATTLCIAAYDAEALAWFGQGRFCSALRAHSEHGRTIEHAHLVSHAKDIVHRYGQPRDLALTTTSLGWSDAWAGWTLEIAEGDELSWLWVNYVTELTNAPVYMWTAGARRQFHLVSPTTSGTLEFASPSLYVATCEQCDAVMPHVFREQSCVGCDVELRGGARAPTLAQETFMREADQILQSFRVTRPMLTLPTPLLTLALLRIAMQSPRYDALKLSVSSAKSILYRLASACVQLRVVNSTPGTILSVQEIKQSTKARAHCLATVDDKTWHAAVASALSVLGQKGQVLPVIKGEYRVPQ